MVADVRITVKARNNRILRAMEERGIFTVAQLARQLKEAGLGVSITQLHALISMRKLPVTSNNRWRESVEHLAQFLRCLPEDLFSEWQRKLVLTQNTISADAKFTDLVAISDMASSPSPGIEYDRKEFIEKLSQVLNSLPARQERILRLRFGIDTEVQTLEEIGEELNVSKARARQIEIEALRKLMHSSHSRELRSFLEDFGIAEPTKSSKRVTAADRHYVPQWKLDERSKQNAQLDEQAE